MYLLRHCRSPTTLFVVLNPGSPLPKSAGVFLLGYASRPPPDGIGRSRRARFRRAMKQSFPADPPPPEAAQPDPKLRESRTSRRASDRRAVAGGFRREVHPRRQHWFLNEKSGFPFRTPAFCSVSRGQRRFGEKEYRAPSVTPGVALRPRTQDLHLGPRTRA
jgi:hypothetical protein